MDEFLIDYWIIFFAIALIFGCSIGAVVAKKNLFPIPQYRAIRNRFRPQPSAIKFKLRVAMGNSKMDLGALDGPESQSIGPDIVTDFDAILVADPFLCKQGERLWLFFEAMERETQKGIISAAYFDHNSTWIYHGKVLEENFHLSYPQVFEHDGEFWMIPETTRDLSIRLYKARNFPAEWELHSILLKGHTFCDSTIFRHNQKWMMFSSQGNKHLNLYIAPELTGPWTIHPSSPIVSYNTAIARCGGRVVYDSGKMFRIAQDGERYYGHSLRAFNITQLDEKIYQEVETENSPILTPAKGTWRPFGCHHFDSVEHNGRWFIAADGF